MSEKLMGLLIVIFCLLNINPAYAQDVLVWEECVREAKENHPDLVSAAEKVRQAKRDLDIDLSAILPQVTTDASGKQFLIESITMTLNGGLMGVLLGIIASVAMSFFAGWATKVTILNVILAAAFSIAVGMFFGLWPAKKASELDPIEALRYE